MDIKSATKVICLAALVVTALGFALALAMGNMGTALLQATLFGLNLWNAKRISLLSSSDEE